MDKFEFTNEKKMLSKKVSVRRIRALRDIEESGVKKGDIGGFLQYRENLSNEGSCWVYEDAIVEGLNTLVTGNARIFGKAMIWAGSKIMDGVTVLGYARIKNSVLEGDRIFIEDNVGLTDCHVKGTDISMFDDANLEGMHFNYRCKKIRIRHQAVMKNHPTPLFVHVNEMNIQGNARLENLYELVGSSISVTDDAVIQDNVHVDGSHIDLSGASSVQGSVVLKDRITLSEFASIYSDQAFMLDITRINLAGDVRKEITELR